MTTSAPSTRARTRAAPPASPPRAERERYHVYVLELPAGAVEHCEGACSGHKGVLYVGSTGKTVAERYAEHLAGGASHITGRYRPVRRRADLDKDKHAFSREKAELIEHKLAQSLRARGFAVCQG